MRLLPSVIGARRAAVVGDVAGIAQDRADEPQIVAAGVADALASASLRFLLNSAARVRRAAIFASGIGCLASAGSSASSARAVFDVMARSLGKLRIG